MAAIKVAPANIAKWLLALVDKFGDSGIDTPKLTPPFQLTALFYSLHEIIIIINISGQFGSEGLVSTAIALAKERFFLH